MQEATSQSSVTLCILHAFGMEAGCFVITSPTAGGSSQSGRGLHLIRIFFHGPRHATSSPSTGPRAFGARCRRSRPPAPRRFSLQHILPGAPVAPQWLLPTPGRQLRTIGLGAVLQVDVLLLDAAPEPPDKPIVHPAATPMHAHVHAHRHQQMRGNCSPLSISRTLYLFALGVKMSSKRMLKANLQFMLSGNLCKQFPELKKFVEIGVISC